MAAGSGEYRALLDSMLQAVVATDMEGRITAWNRPAERLLGWTEKELLGRPLTDFMPSAEILEQTKEIQAVVRSGSPWQGEGDAHTKGGRVLPIELSASAMRDGQGNITGLLGVFHGITERKQVDVDLRERVKELRALNRMATEGAKQSSLEGLLRLAVEALEPAFLHEDLWVRARVGDTEVTSTGKPPGGPVLAASFETVGGAGLIEVQYRSTHPEQDHGPFLQQEQELLDTVTDHLVTFVSRNHAITELQHQAQLLKSVRQAVMATDLEGKITYWNKGAEKVYGWTQEEVIGRSITDVTPSEVSEKQAKEIFSQLQKGESWTGEFPVRRKDGSSFWAMVHDAPMLDDQGHMVGIIGVSFDITKQREAQEQLLFQGHLLGAVGQAVTATDLEGKITFWNEPAEALYGWTREEAMGRSVAELLGEAYIEEPSPETADEPTSTSVDHWMARKDESRVLVNLATSPIVDDGGLRGFVAIGQDVTARRRMQKRFQEVVENAPYGVYRTRRDGKLVLANPEYARIAGYESVKELMDDLDSVELFYVDLIDRAKIIETVDRNGVIEDFEFRIQRPDGETRWVSATVYKSDAQDADMEGFIRDITEARESERLRLEAENQYRGVVENAPYGIMRTRKDGTIVLANPEVARIVGYGSAEELMDAGVSVGTFYADPEVRERLIQIVQREGRVDDFDLRVRRKNGELNWVRVTMYPSGADDAELEGFIRDIEEVRESERMRIAAEAQYRSVVENAPYGVVRSRKDGTLVLANPEFARMVGYDSVAELQQNLVTLASLYADPDDRARMIEALQRDGRLDDFEVRLRRRDGSLRWVQATIYPSDADDADMEAFMRDVTDLHRLEEEKAKAALRLEDEMAYTEAILRSLPGIVYTIRQDGTFIRWNDNFLAVTGYSKAEVATMNALDLFEGDDKELIAARIEKVFTDGEANAEAELVPKDGTTTPYYFTGIRLRVAGEPVLIGVGLDMTEKKRAEAADLQAKVMQEMAEFRATFLNMAAHELSTPLTPLALEMHLIRSEKTGPLNDKQRDAIALLDRNLRRLQLLVQDMLDAARMQAGTLKFFAEPMDLRRVISDTAEVYAGPAQEKGCTIEYGGPDELQVHADSQRFEQVVFNLVSNAIRYSPDGGRIQVRATSETDHVKVEVRDEGIGLDATQIGRLFHPFTQVHDTAKVRGGTGLGLYITKGIVELHGGTIGVESEGAGKGSAFWFTVPTKAPQKEAETAGRAPDGDA